MSIADQVTVNPSVEDGQRENSGIDGDHIQSNAPSRDRNSNPRLERNHPRPKSHFSGIEMMVLRIVNFMTDLVNGRV